MSSRWPSRVAAFLLWALMAASAVYWLLRVAGMDESRIVADGVAQAPAPIQVADLARALGPASSLPAAAPAASLQPAAPDPGARMRLIGVVAGRRSGGVALIAIDGLAARPYRVGTQVGDVYRLTRVDKRSATLSAPGSADAPITLELPTAAGPTAKHP